jgi:hypothetical protein
VVVLQKARCNLNESAIYDAFDGAERRRITLSKKWTAGQFHLCKKRKAARPKAGGRYKGKPHNGDMVL